MITVLSPITNSFICWNSRESVVMIMSIKGRTEDNTMANWVIQTAETYMKTFSDAFLRELLKQAVIHADETLV